MQKGWVPGVKVNTQKVEATCSFLFWPSFLAWCLKQSDNKNFMTLNVCLIGDLK